MKIRPNTIIEIDNVIENAFVMADEKQIRQACSNLIKNLFENLATDYLSDFILDSSQRIMMMKVTKVSSADKLDNLLDILDKMISIKEYSITSFKQNEISFSLKIFGTEDQFIQTVKTHKDFLLEEYSTELIQASLSTI